MIREVQFLTKARITLLCDRRKFGPYGLKGGQPGATGRNLLMHADGKTTELPSKFTGWIQPGDILSIQTPGGGGWGRETETLKD